MSNFDASVDLMRTDSVQVIDLKQDGSYFADDYLQLHFLERKDVYFDLNFADGTINSKPGFLQGVVLRRTGADHYLTQFAYICCTRFQSVKSNAWPMVMRSH